MLLVLLLALLVLQRLGHMKATPGSLLLLWWRPGLLHCGQYLLLLLLRRPPGLLDWGRGRVLLRRQWQSQPSRVALHESRVWNLHLRQGILAP